MELTDIQIPSDLRDCSLTELEVIAQHIRNLIIHRTSHIGGHIGSSLGATDIIVALHHVFSLMMLNLYLIFPIKVMLIKF